MKAGSLNFIPALSAVIKSLTGDYSCIKLSGIGSLPKMQIIAGKPLILFRILQ
jgi:hypothetical protein